MSDQTITCADCHQEFVFTQGEQQFYRQKNIRPPIYCAICRAKHKAKIKQFAPYRTQKPSSQ